MSGDLTHADQYRMLREEILDQVGETRRLEIFTLAGLAVFYTVLLTHGAAAGGRAAYWLAPAMVFLAAVRCWAALARIDELAAYLRELEVAAFGPIGDNAARSTSDASVFDQKWKLTDLYRAEVRTYDGKPMGWEQHVQKYASHHVARSALAFWLGVFVFTVLMALALPDIAAIRP